LRKTGNTESGRKKKEGRGFAPPPKKEKKEITLWGWGLSTEQGDKARCGVENLD